MERIIIRTHARGPLGFVRLAADGADAGVTYAAVRSAIAEQLFEVILDEAYVFLLEDGVPVAPSQEATERAAKGMTECLLAFSSEPRAPAAGITSPQSLAAGAAGANAGVLGAAPERSPFLQVRYGLLLLARLHRGERRDPLIHHRVRRLSRQER